MQSLRDTPDKMIEQLYMSKESTQNLSINQFNETAATSELQNELEKSYYGSNAWRSIESKKRNGSFNATHFRSIDQYKGSPLFSRTTVGLNPSAKKFDQVRTT